MLQSKWVKTVAEIGVICIEILVEGKGKDRSTKRGSAHDEQ